MEYKEILELQEEAMRKAFIDAHVAHVQRKADLHTYADFIAGMFRQGKKEFLVKRSYMFLNSVDFTFYWTAEGKAAFSFSGWAGHGLEDVAKLPEAFQTAKRVVEDMQDFFEEAKREAGK